MARANSGAAPWRAPSTSWGKLGTAGQTKSKLFPTADAANAELAKLVREKRNKGYVDDDSQAAPPGAAPSHTAKPPSKSAPRGTDHPDPTAGRSRHGAVTDAGIITLYDTGGFLTVGAGCSEIGLIRGVTTNVRIKSGYAFDDLGRFGAVDLAGGFFTGVPAAASTRQRKIDVVMKAEGSAESGGIRLFKFAWDASHCPRGVDDEKGICSPGAGRLSTTWGEIGIPEGLSFSPTSGMSLAAAGDGRLTLGIGHTAEDPLTVAVWQFLDGVDMGWRSFGLHDTAFAPTVTNAVAVTSW